VPHEQASSRGLLHAPEPVDARGGHKAQINALIIAVIAQDTSSIRGYLAIEHLLCLHLLR
jgi:hypothetical protein